MKNRANILRTAAAAVLAAALLLTACSRRNVNMSKHRKSRKCNCPTFTERHPDNSIDTASTINYVQRGRV